MTPHCRNPERCSVCLCEPARVVSITAGVTLLDGVPAPQTRSQMREAAQRGALATKRRFSEMASTRVPDRDRLSER